MVNTKFLPILSPNRDIKSPFGDEGQIIDCGLLAHGNRGRKNSKNRKLENTTKGHQTLAKLG